MTVQTTRVFAAMRRMYVLLHDETLWNNHPDTNQPPQILFGGHQNTYLEQVVIVGSPPDPPETDFATLSAVSQDEAFGLRVVFQTGVQGQSGEETSDRLEYLVSVAEMAVRDQNTGVPIGGFGRAEGEAGCLWWRAARFDPNFYPTSEGIAGQCPVDFAFRARL